MIESIVVERIVSRRDFGTIFSGRTKDGATVRVRADRNALMGVPEVGQIWSVHGEIENTTWGAQVKASRAVHALPSGRLMIDFMSRSVAGIGPGRAQRLWERFQERLPEALDVGDVDHIARVLEPDRPVLGPRLAAALVATWRKMAGEARLVEWLAAVGVTDVRLARRIYTLLGDEAPSRLQNNPWCLVPLLSWSKVDELGLRVARENGITVPQALPQRLTGAADAVVKDLIALGSTAIKTEDFRSKLATKLETTGNSPILGKAFALATERHAVVPAIEGLLRAPGCAVMEDHLAARLAKLARQGPSRQLRNVLDGIGANFGALSEEQALAVRKALSAGFTCLRGGAGTGKTHVAREICRLWEAAGGNVLLAAVAGKAALQLSRSTGRLARTVARTLHQLDERARIRNELAAHSDPDEREKLEARLRDLAHADENTMAIVDEASMLDLSSLHGLLRRLPNGARLLLIGDECQLPPVNFGLLFHRFVRDQRITATLQSVHRHSAASGIPVVAGLLRRRQMPNLALYGTSIRGVLLLPADGRDDIADKVISTRQRLLGQSEVMVLTPVNDGPCGVAGLNRRLHDDYVARTELQELRGPLGDLFSPGEPVVHRRNDYRRGLFNGSVGRVRRIERSQRSLTAVFDEEEHVFAGDELVDLALGYALTCHRAQGSEAKNVIIALSNSRLLDPSWLYTAVTRASELAVLVGQEKTIEEALGRPYPEDRRVVGLNWPPASEAQPTGHR